MNALVYTVMGVLCIAAASPARHRLESFGGARGGAIEYDDFVPGKTVRGPKIVGPQATASKLGGPHIGLTYIVGPELGPPRIVTPIVIPGHITAPDGTHDPIVGPKVGVIAIVGPSNPWSKLSEDGYEWKNGWLDW
ncbi:uncharacterized protein LOC108905418 [Anoplophora glabripennis]|uniref:uncharacterized protein LOC108905418 n=1 Tax=Anoplophora glabripennis TaxID=217634 RepID=UPI0008735276|nr:uncharacterized protein LOC108905418 [Anoplophora glabripennis]